MADAAQDLYQQIHWWLNSLIVGDCQYTT